MTIRTSRIRNTTAAAVAAWVVLAGCGADSTPEPAEEAGSTPATSPDAAAQAPNPSSPTRRALLRGRH